MAKVELVSVLQFDGQDTALGTIFAGNPIVRTYPFPVRNKQSNSLEFGSQDILDSQKATNWNSNHWYYMAFHVYWDGSINNTDFFSIFYNNLSEIIFNINSLGGFSVRDDFGNIILIHPLTVESNTWYTFQIAGQLSSGNIKVWGNKELEELGGRSDLLIDETNRGPTTASSVFGSFGNFVTSPKLYLSDFIFYRDSSTGSNPHSSFPISNFTVIGPLQSNNPYPVSDFGDNLTSGVWNDAMQIPFDNSTFISFSNTIDGQSSPTGGVSFSSGNRRGPKDNPDFDNTIIGSFWRATHSRSGGETTTFHLFAGAHEEPSYDTTTEIATANSTDNFQDLLVGRTAIGDEKDIDVPTINEYVQMRFSGEDYPGASYDILLGDVGVWLVHLEVPISSSSSSSQSSSSSSQSSSSSSLSSSSSSQSSSSSSQSSSSSSLSSSSSSSASPVLTSLGNSFLFYADYFAWAAESGLNRARTLFSGINISTLINPITVINKPNLIPAMNNFTRLLDTSYEYLWIDGQDLNPIKDAFEGLANYINSKTSKTINNFLEDEAIQVMPTYGSISNRLGENIDAKNISDIVLSVQAVPLNSVDTATNRLLSTSLASNIVDTISVPGDVDWFDISGGTPSITTDYNSWIKSAISDNNLNIFVQININDGSSIPITPSNFGNPIVRSAYKADVMNRVRLLNPTYVNLGANIQNYLNAVPNDFDNFISLFQETRDIILDYNINTIVMVSWDYEDLLGLTNGINSPATRSPQWDNLNRFEPYQDVVGITSYPSATKTTFGDPANLPNSYYTKINQHTNAKLVITELGWSHDQAIGGSVEFQEEFIHKFMNQMNALNVKLVNYNFLTDVFGFGVFFEKMGLYDSKGNPYPIRDAIVNKWGKLSL